MRAKLRAAIEAAERELRRARAALDGGEQPDVVVAALECARRALRDEQPEIKDGDLPVEDRR